MTSQSSDANPKVFILDGEGNGRDWNGLLPGHDSLQWNVGIGGRPGAFYPERPTPGSVVVCHQISDSARAAIAGLSGEGVHVVHVSLAQGKGLRDDGTYERRRSVEKTSNDTLFARCFALFLRDLGKTRIPKWELLEGVVPEHILAYHLCGLLDESSAKRLQAALREVAEIEGEVLAELSPAGKSAWSNENLDNREKLREFLREHA